MIGFWTRDVAREARRAPLTACGPMPRASRACTWPTLIAEDADATSAHDASAHATSTPPLSVPQSVPTRHTVAEVRPAWQALPPARPPARPPAGGGGHEPWAGRPLTVPEQRNNHFFVRGMGEFLFDHLTE